MSELNRSRVFGDSWRPQLSSAPGEQSQSLSLLQTEMSLPRESLGRGRTGVARSPRARKRKTGAREIKLKVLVVDDVPDVTEMIGLFLKHAGYEVTTAESGAAALKLASERQFDLIVSDIGMPEMTGYELAEVLRAHAGYQKTPIIAVTGYSEYDDRGRALKAGFNAHLTKPIDPTRLLDLINELLG